MAEDKKSFVMYCDLIHVVEKMPDDKAGLLLKHLLRYVNDLNPTTDDLIVDLAFEPIKQQLKRDLSKYNEKKAEKSESGRLGNLKRWNPDLYSQVILEKITLDEAEKIAKNRKVSHSDNSPSQQVANIAVNVNDSVTVNDNVNVISNIDSSVEVSTSPHPSKKFDFKKSLIEYGLSENLATEYMKVRKDKKASNTETALNSILKEIEISGKHIDECIEVCIINSWKGFKAEWINNQSKTFNNGKSNNNLSANEKHELAKAGLAERDEKRFNMFSE